MANKHGLNCGYFDTDGVFMDCHCGNWAKHFPLYTTIGQVISEWNTHFQTESMNELIRLVDEAKDIKVIRAGNIGDIKDICLDCQRHHDVCCDCEDGSLYLSPDAYDEDLKI